MLRIGLLALLGFALVEVAPAWAACAGADPAIASVAVKSVAEADGINPYTLAVTVTNDGSQAQAKDVMQFVDIYQVPGEKLDAKGIPPLRAGQSYTFTYVTMRSAEAGNGTTHLRFQLDVRQPSRAAAANCNGANDTRTLTF
jgi:hypothetical protein